MVLFYQGGSATNGATQYSTYVGFLNNFVDQIFTNIAYIRITFRVTAVGWQNYLYMLCTTMIYRGCIDT